MSGVPFRLNSMTYGGRWLESTRAFLYETRSAAAHKPCERTLPARVTERASLCSMVGYLDFGERDFGNALGIPAAAEGGSQTARRMNALLRERVDALRE